MLKMPMIVAVAPASAASGSHGDERAPARPPFLSSCNTQLRRYHPGTQRAMTKLEIDGCIAVLDLIDNVHHLLLGRAHAA